jgi:hypothetical protein
LPKVVIQACRHKVAVFSHVHLEDNGVLNLRYQHFPALLLSSAEFMEPLEEKLRGMEGSLYLF